MTTTDGVAYNEGVVLMERRLSHPEAVANALVVADGLRSAYVHNQHGFTMVFAQPYADHFELSTQETPILSSATLVEVAPIVSLWPANMDRFTFELGFVTPAVGDFTFGMRATLGLDAGVEEMNTFQGAAAGSHERARCTYFAASYSSSFDAVISASLAARCYDSNGAPVPIRLTMCTVFAEAIATETT